MWQELYFQHLVDALDFVLRWWIHHLGGTKGHNVSDTKCFTPQMIKAQIVSWLSVNLVWLQEVLTEAQDNGLIILDLTIFWTAHSFMGSLHFIFYFPLSRISEVTVLSPSISGSQGCQREQAPCMMGTYCSNGGQDTPAKARAPVLWQELTPGAGSGTVKPELGFQEETSD